MKEMSRNYRWLRFVNLSMNSLGIFSDECFTLLDMMNDIDIDKKAGTLYNNNDKKRYYNRYIFCYRKKNWDSADLMKL